ncbi:hypothetical protein [Streptomyces sp. NPDC048272]|uniref:hypothetical protein n=1 Tax=Streptomyces sp. NPDC048272 TaxID=3154616 RepID=UPI00343E7E60
MTSNDLEAACPVAQLRPNDPPSASPSALVATLAALFDVRQRPCVRLAPPLPFPLPYVEETPQP